MAQLSAVLYEAYASVRDSLTWESRRGVDTQGRPDLQDSDEHSWGLQVLEEDPKSEVDIVAIHGLNGHRLKTWTAENGKMWLKEFLAADVRTPARIITYGYDARTISIEKTLSLETIHDHSLAFLQDLCSFREDTETTRRPILFIAHSLGGIVLKDALILSNLTSERHLERYMDVKTSTFGILFLGTPHLGGQGVSLGRYLGNIASIYYHVDDRVLKHLEHHTEYLVKQMDLYKSISQDFDTSFGYETYETKILSGISTVIVEKWSAFPSGITDAEGIPIRKDHISMGKFETDTDDNYVRIVRCLRLMIKRSMKRVEENWERYDSRKDGGDKTIQIKKRKQWLSEVGFRITSEQLPRRNLDFVGRLTTLDEMRSLLQKPNKKQTVILCGQGGIGKTEIALQYTWAEKSQYSAIFWFNAATPEILQNSFVAAANQLISHYASSCPEEKVPYGAIADFLGFTGYTNEQGKICEEHCSSAVIVQAVKFWLNREKNSRWLLVFDNYNDRELFLLEKFLPEAANGSIIITSQLRDTAGFGQAIQVHCFSLKEASEDDETVLKDLGLLPLAIAHAGAYMFNESVSSATYREELQKSFRNALRHIPQVSRYPTSVFASFELSYEAISRKRPSASNMLLLCSLYFNVDIPKRILGNESDPDSTTSDLSLLLSYSLVKKAQQDSITIHPITHGCARETLNTEKKRIFTRTALLNLAGNLNSSLESEFVRSVADWAFERRLSLHVGKIAALALDLWSSQNGPEDIGEHIWLVFAQYYQMHGVYEKSEIFYQKALSKSEEAHGEIHKKTLQVALSMGKLYRLQFRMDKARPLYKRCIEHEERLSERERARANTGLAVINYTLRNFSEAEELYHRAWTTLKAVLPSDHPEIIAIMDGLANTYSKQQKFIEADALWQEILSKNLDKLGAEHPSIMRAMQNRGLDYLRQDRNEEAQALFEKVLKARKAVLGPNHPSTLRTEQNLAHTHYQQRQFKDAIEVYISVNSRREKLLGAYHVDTIRGLQMLAEVQVAFGNKPEAIKLLEDALRRLDAEDDSGRKRDSEEVINALQKLQRKNELEAPGQELLEGSKRVEALPWMPKAVPENNLKREVPIKSIFSQTHR